MRQFPLGVTQGFSTAVCFLLCLVVLGNSLFALADSSDDQIFRIHGPSYAFLDCSACIAFADHLGRRMNASLQYDAGGAASFIASQRQSDGKNRHVYATSELRAAEVLDKICNDTLLENYVLRLDPDRLIRVYQSEKSNFVFAQYYSTKDAKALKSITSSAVHTFCTRLMSEKEESMINLVRDVRQMEDLVWRMCGGNGNSSEVVPPSPKEPVTKVCVGIEESEKMELRRIKRYEEWENALSEKGGRMEEKSFVVRKLQRRQSDPLTFIVPGRRDDSEGGDGGDNENDERMPAVGETYPLDLDL